MRFGVAVFFLIVGCSASEAAREVEPAAPKVGDIPAVGAASSPTEPSGVTSAITDPPASPRLTESTRTKDEPFNPALLDLQGQSCPIPASTCPDGCASVTGWRFEEANQCYSRVVVACLPAANYSMNGDLGCYKRDDGVILATSPTTIGHKLGLGWSGCDLNEDFTEAPPCL